MSAIAVAAISMTKVAVPIIDTLHQNAADFPGIIMTPALTAALGLALYAPL